MALRAPPEERSPAELLRFGVVNLDKPPGPSAHQVSGWVRDLVADAMADAGHDGIEKAAHAGTLDPKVTGCLPVLLGDATRLAQVFLEGAKEYVAVLELHGRAPADLAAVAAEFEGEIYQKPPRKSAVARRLRTRRIHDLDVLEVEERRALLRIRCESGTYVRKLCHDLGLALGTGAHMGDLRRTATEPFDDRDLVSMHDLADALAFWSEAPRASEGSSGARREQSARLESANGEERPASVEQGDPRDSGDEHETTLREVVGPGERALTHLPTVTIAPSAAREVANGAPVYAPGVIDADVDPPGAADRRPLVACYTPNGSVVCLGRLVGDPDASSGTVVELERVLV